MSLDGAYDRENVFAKILRGDIPAHVIAEDDATIAFMDAFPQSPGHCLVVPKAEARNLLDLDPGAVPTLFSQVQRIAGAVRAALEPDGLVITQFNGAPAGQTVFHLHVHIIPRWDGRALAGHGQAGMADGDELANTARRIAAALT